MWILVRHGQTEWNQDNRIQGNKDSPLTELGKKQSLEVGYWINKVIDVNKYSFFSSTKKRSTDSARIIANQLQQYFCKMPVFCQSSHLDDKGFGEWEGYTLEYRNSILEEEELSTYTYSKYNYDKFGIESYEELDNRVRLFINQNKRLENVLIMSHQTVSQSLLANLCNLDTLHTPKLKNNEFFLVEPEKNRFCLVSS